MKKKYIKVKKGIFKKLKFKIEVSPFGKKKCCCGYLDCVDLDCLEYMLSKNRLK